MMERSLRLFLSADFTNANVERKVLCIKYIKLKLCVTGRETSESLTVFKKTPPRRPNEIEFTFHCKYLEIN